MTGSGFITLAATLSAFPTIPVAGLALLLGVDRFMSEARAITNLIGNAVATVVIARWENELGSGPAAPHPRCCRHRDVSRRAMRAIRAPGGSDH